MLLREPLSEARDTKHGTRSAARVDWLTSRIRALTARGIEVREITGAHSERVHALTPFARGDGIRTSYPPQSTAT